MFYSFSNLLEVMFLQSSAKVSSSGYGIYQLVQPEAQHLAAVSLHFSAHWAVGAIKSEMYDDNIVPNASILQEWKIRYDSIIVHLLFPVDRYYCNIILGKWTTERSSSEPMAETIFLFLCLFS